MDIKYLVFTGEQMFLHASAGVLGVSAAYNFSRGKYVIGALEVLAAVGVEILVVYNGANSGIYQQTIDKVPPKSDMKDITDSI